MPAGDGVGGEGPPAPWRNLYGRRHGKKLKPKAKGRKLKLKPKGRDGAGKVGALLKRGAVIVDGKVRKPFKLTIRDAHGKKTRLSVKAK